MKTRDIANLLNNAAAVIESGDGCGLSDRELSDLVDDLLSAAKAPTEPAQELLRALVALTAIADEMIPCDNASNYQLAQAEQAISNAHRVIADVTNRG